MIGSEQQSAVWFGQAGYARFGPAKNGPVLHGLARQARQDMAEWGCVWNCPEMQARNSSFVLVRAAIGLVRQARQDMAQWGCAWNDPAMQAWSRNAQLGSEVSGSAGMEGTARFGSVVFCRRGDVFRDIALCGIAGVTWKCEPMRRQDRLGLALQARFRLARMGLAGLGIAGSACL